MFPSEIVYVLVGLFLAGYAMGAITIACLIKSIMKGFGI